MESILLLAGAIAGLVIGILLIPFVGGLLSKYFEWVGRRFFD